MTRLDFVDDPDEFAQTLEDAGMPSERAHVMAYVQHGKTHSEIGDALDKAKGTVGDLKDDALVQTSEARKIAHYLHKPEYLTELPSGTGGILNDQMDSSMSFRLNRPRRTSSAVDAEYTLEDADTIEGWYTDDDEYFLKFQSLAGGRRGTTKYFVLESQYLVRFIHDWVAPNRLSEIRTATSSADFADEWFLTDAFAPEWLEEELAEVGIERVEAITDDRFVNPLTEHVEVADSARTGWSHEGFKVAYSPTGREVAELLDSGEIDEDEAERITRIPPENLRKLV